MNNALPTLYKRTSVGAIQVWRIWTEGVRIITEYGQNGGKFTRAEETVKVARSQPTLEAQAAFEAEAAWKEKLSRKGYTQSFEKARDGGNDGKGGIRPMLALKYEKEAHKLKFPCFAQPKLDGIRCIAVVGDDGDVSLWTREQKALVATPHIAQAVAALELPAGTILDGELYNHDLKDDFEKIVSLVRRQEPLPYAQAKLIQYHVYDFPRVRAGAKPAPFYVRAKLLEALAEAVKARPTVGDFVKVVETMECEDDLELQAAFSAARGLGYEGAMARGADAPYKEGGRSDQLLKLKELDDDEFAICGVEEGVGNMAGCAIFTCLVDPKGPVTDANTFGCKMEGPLDGLRKYLTDHTLWQGKKLTVRFQGYTGGGKPRFPIGKAVRDYE